MADGFTRRNQRSRYQVHRHPTTTNHGRERRDDILAIFGLISGGLLIWDISRKTSSTSGCCDALQARTQELMLCQQSHVTGMPYTAVPR